MRLAIALVLAAATVVALWSVRPSARSNPRTAPAQDQGPKAAPASRPPEAAAPRSPAVLRGSVVEDATGNPVAGAKVVAYAFGSGRILEATSDGDGRFALGHGAPFDDAFEVVARHEGFGPASVRAVAARDIAVMRLPEASCLRGRVVAMDDRSAVCPCRVSAVRSPGSRGFHESRLDKLVPVALVTDAVTTTRADGTFEITGVAPGTYTLLVEANGFAPSDERVVVTREAEESDIALFRAAEVLVDVFDEQTGAPLEGAFFEMDTLAGWQARVPLDAQEMGSGGYALQLGLWNGSIALMLLRAGRQGYASRDLLLWRPDRGDSLYHLGRGERFPLALGRGATICGHVRSSGRPEPGAVLVVEPASSCLALTATTGPDGAFEVAGIDAAGSAIVHVYDRALDPVTTVSLRLQHGERRTIEINAPGTTAIEGRVVLGGAPAANAEVMLSGATQARSATGPDGSYRIEGLNAGCHEVQVSASGGYLTRRVTVAESQSVRLDIATTCTISGVVVDGQTGLPVLDPYLAIEARRSGAEDRAIAFGSRFRLHVDAGTHRVDCLSERVHPGEPPTVEATAGDSEIVLRIFQGLCAVTLDVRDGRTNENVPACVYEYKTGGIHRGERPRAGEEVTIRDLRPGVYRFRIWSDAHAPAEVEVTLDEGQQVRETIALPRADGVRIVHVVRDTEAARAGLRAGDRILSWNGVATPSIAACYAASDGAKGTARIEFERDGKGGFIDVPTGSLYLDLENVPLDR